MGFRIVLDLPQDVKDALGTEVAGEGGFQTFLHKLQGQVSNGEITLYDSDLEKLERYATMYGSGGFQHRLESLLKHVAEALKFVL